MILFIAAIIGFVGMFGLGLSTNIWADWLGVSKRRNDTISFLAGIAIAILMVYIS
jgi:hypothetical protein